MHELCTYEKAACPGGADGPGPAAAAAFAGPPWVAARERLRRLCPPGGRLLVAASGGPDSQALLAFSAHVAPACGLSHAGAASIDHGTRPAAAAERGLAAALAARCGLAFRERAVSLPARGNRLAAARAARYLALAELAREVGASAVALGHTEDDLAETLLWHLLRGSAAACFTAMPARQGLFIRPFLGVSRVAIEHAVTALGLACAQDPSNLQPGRMRAAMRTHLWPAIEAVVPAAKAQLCRGLAAERREQAQLVRASRRAAARLIGGDASRPRLDLRGWRALCAPLRRRVLRHFLLGAGLVPSGAQLAALARSLRIAQPGAALAQASLKGGTLRRQEPFLWRCAPADLRPRRPRGSPRSGPGPGRAR